MRLQERAYLERGISIVSLYLQVLLMRCKSAGNRNTGCNYIRPLRMLGRVWLRRTIERIYGGTLIIHPTPFHHARNGENGKIHNSIGWTPKSNNLERILNALLMTECEDRFSDEGYISLYKVISADVDIATQAGINIAKQANVRYNRSPKLRNILS